MQKEVAFAAKKVIVVVGEPVEEAVIRSDPNRTLIPGLIVDAVSQVMELAHDDIRPVPDFGTSVKMDYLIGMARSGKKFALLLDVDKVLTTEELRDLSLVSSLAENAELAEFSGEGTTSRMEAVQNLGRENARPFVSGRGQ